MITVYAIEMLIGKQWLVAWQSPKGDPLLYKRYEDAQSKLASHLVEWREAVAEGFIESVPRADQFRIVTLELEEAPKVKGKRKSKSKRVRA